MSEESISNETAAAPDVDTPPGDHVLELALALFDGTLPLHDLGEDGHSLLEMAARLRKTPLRGGKKKKPHQAALDVVRARAGSELSDDNQRTLAAVLAYHQGKVRRKDLKRFELSPVQERQTLTITALLRIASGLDHSNSGQTILQKVEVTPEALWIVVDGPKAASDSLAARQKAGLWEKIGYPPVQVLEPAEAAIRLMPFPKPAEHIGLTRDDTLAEAGRKVMRFHFAEMLRYEEGTRTGEDIEDLHHMRVATRRLRAGFEVFNSAFEAGTLKLHLKGLRATGRALGTVRDLDVFMEKAERYLRSLPEGQEHDLDPLLETWHAQRDTARMAMLAWMNSAEYAAFKRNFNIFLNTPGAGARPLPVGQPVPHRVNELAPVLIFTRLAAVRAYEPFLHDAPVETLHALRIEFKKLRYTFEYFQEALGKQAAEVIDAIKKLQDHLGDLNDADVAVALLRQFSNEWEARQAELPIHERRSIDGVINYQAARHAERHELMLAFEAAWQENFHHAAFRRSVAQAIAVL
jgi:CHAD domain-containing protein